MVGSGDRFPGQTPTGDNPPASRGRGGGTGREPFAGPDPRLLPLLNLSAIGQKMDNLRRFLSDSIDRRASLGGDQLQMVSSEIASAVQDVILNSAALLANSLSVSPALLSSSSPSLVPPSPFPGVAAVDPSPLSATTPRVPDTGSVDPPSANFGGGDNEGPSPEPVAADGDDCDVVEIDTAELMAEHVHFCEICGKGFKRDANLRMHMRAHGDRFKTLEALSKPDRDVPPPDGGESTAGRRIRFSCPYPGCNRNRAHKKFRSMKSVACVKNHFKRSHCPKTYSCHRCNKKSFSVVTDLKSHLKHCGENRWRCSCGTNFSRKDKLFGHVALFEGHMPAVDVGLEEETKKNDAILEDGGEEEGAGGEEQDGQGFYHEFFKGLMEDFHDTEQRNWRAHAL